MADDLTDDWTALDPNGPNGPFDPQTLTREKGDLAIGTSGNRVLVIIKPDGQLVFGPGYTPDRAAMEFWEAMASKRLEAEDRLLVIEHMEGALTRLGAADLHNEAMQQRLTGSMTTDNLIAAQRAQCNLERAMHQCIELGRALTRRPQVAQRDVPERVPDQVRQNPDSNYTGAAGFDGDDEPARDDIDEMFDDI
jgi:hypothetical protein